jgi:hypothetical protein
VPEGQWPPRPLLQGAAEAGEEDNSPLSPHFSKPSICTRLTFPPQSIHSRIVFPELSFAAATAANSLSHANQMAAAEHYTAGFPGQRPAQGRATVVAGGAMTAELQKLRRKAVILTAIDSIPQV